MVATAVGGIPEIVVDGETGFLLPYEQVDAAGTPKDAEALARDLAMSMNELLRDGEGARKMGVAGRRRAAEHFSWKRIGEQTAELYARLLA